MKLPSPPRNSLARLRTAGLVERYLSAKENAGRSPNTVYGYRLLLESLAKCHHRLPLDPDPLESFIRGCIDYAPDTLIDRFGIVRGFYNWLVRREVLALDQNPFRLMDAPPRNRSPVRRVLSLGEMRRAVEVSIAPFERALTLILVDCGPRIGELAGRTKDDLMDGVIRLYGKEGGRLAPLSPDVYAYLQNLPTHYLFPQMRRVPGGPYQAVDAPGSVEALRARAHRVLVRSGLSGSKLGPHVLRHSFATQYINRGGDLKSLSLILGHITMHMTEKYVTLAMDSLKRKHAEFSVLDAVRGLVPTVSAEELPDAELPLEAAKFPTHLEGCLTLLFLVSDRRPNHTFYYIRAREAGRSGRDGAKKWRVCSLGTDLPLNEVDALRQAIYRENLRRQTVTNNTEP